MFLMVITGLKGCRVSPSGTALTRVGFALATLHFLSLAVCVCTALQSFFSHQQSFFLLQFFVLLWNLASHCFALIFSQPPRIEAALAFCTVRGAHPLAQHFRQSVDIRLSVRGSSPCGVLMAVGPSFTSSAKLRAHLFTKR